MISMPRSEKPTVEVRALIKDQLFNFSLKNSNNLLETLFNLELEDVSQEMEDKMVEDPQEMEAEAKGMELGPLEMEDALLENNSILNFGQEEFYTVLTKCCLHKLHLE